MPDTPRQTHVVPPLLEGCAVPAVVGRFRRRRAVGPICVFVLSIVLVAALISRFLLKVPEGVVSQKLAYFSEYADRYDTIFVGSSRVARHLDPAVFDAEMQRFGWATTTFNLGFPGATFLELKYLMEKEILPSNAKGLRRAIIELELLAEEIAERNRATSRVVYWHDLDATWRAILVLWQRPKPLEFRLRAIHNHLEAFFYRSLNLGLGQAAIERAFGSAVETRNYPDPRFVGPAGDGYVPVTQGTTSTHMKAAREELLANPETLEVMTLIHREKSACGAPCLPISRVEIMTLLGVQEMLKRHKIQPIFFVPPGSYFELTRVGQAAAARGLLENAVSFGNPDEYPELYSFESHFDFTHLNQGGAEVLTRYLAVEIASTAGIAQHNDLH